MSFSQTLTSLTPKIRLENKDTLFCFTMPQVTIIATHLVNSQYCDSLQTSCETQMTQAAELVTLKDSAICILEDKISNQSSMIRDYQLSVDLLQRQLAQQQKIITRQKWVQRLCAIGFVTMSGAYIYKTISNH